MVTASLTTSSAESRGFRSERLRRQAEHTVQRGDLQDAADGIRRGHDEDDATGVPGLDENVEPLGVHERDFGEVEFDRVGMGEGVADVLRELCPRRHVDFASDEQTDSAGRLSDLSDRQVVRNEP